MDGESRAGSGSLHHERGRGGGHASSEGERAQHADGSSCTVSALLQLRIQISNTTSNVPLKLILRASVSPKPRRVSKNSINKSCRSTYQLQLLLKLQSLIRPGLGDTRFQSGVHENSNMNFSHPRLSRFSRFQNSTELNLESSI